MTYFWCEKHKRAERKGEDTAECLLVGPFSTKGQAEAFNGAVRDTPPSRMEPSDRAKLIHENDCPKVWEFWRKHALGSKLCPSCLLCGQQRDREEWAITHAELPDIYICKTCVGAARSERTSRDVEIHDHMRAVVKANTGFDSISDLVAAYVALKKRSEGPYEPPRPPNWRPVS